MLIFAEHGLAYLANPKSGSTAVMLALQPKADIVFKRGRRHMNAKRFLKHVAPFLKDTYDIETETVAVMRNPADQLRSWYKYRTRAELAGTPRSTADISFDEFARAACSRKPPEFAQVRSQAAFLADKQGAVLVDHLFEYDNQAGLIAFLSDRLGAEIVLDQHNVSPDVATPLSDNVAKLLRKKRAADYALYDRLTSKGGYLRRA